MVKKLLEKEWDICIFVKKVVSLQRIMELRVALYRAKSWLRHQLTAWNTGGEGVHSPYLFEWVRMVMMDKNSFYIWGEIERCREKMLRDERELEFVDYGSGKLKGENGKLKGENGERRKVCDIARRSLAKRKYAQMLSRLVNWLGASHRLENGSGTAYSLEFRGLTIVELGTSLGVTTAYMAAMDSRNRVVTFEGCEAVANIAKENWKALNINNIECRIGKIDVEQLAQDIEHLDVAFIDANHTYVSTCEYFDVLAGKVREKSVIVVDDIHYSEEMEKAWKAICADERVTSTIDLYQM